MIVLDHMCYDSLLILIDLVTTVNLLFAINLL